MISEPPRGIPKSPNPVECFVSVIVPFFNSIDSLGRCLRAIEEQTLERQQLEIIAVDDGSTESLNRIVQEFPETCFLRQEKRGPYSARNRGLDVAKGDVVAFTDADCVPDRRWLACGLDALIAGEEKGVEFVGGRVEFFFRDAQSPRAVELYDSMTFMQQERLASERGFVVTANLLAWRRVFTEVGPFDGTLRSGGDGEWGTRATARGYGLSYAPDAIVRHPARYSLAEIVTKWKRVLDGFEDIHKTQGDAALYRPRSAGGLFRPPLRHFISKIRMAKQLKSPWMRFQVLLIHLYVHALRERRLRARRWPVRGDEREISAAP